MTFSTRTGSLRICFSTDCLAQRRQSQTDQMVALQEAHYCSFFTNKFRLSTDTFLFLIGIDEYNLCQNMSAILNSFNQPCKPSWITGITLRSPNPVVHSEETQYCTLVPKCVVLDYPPSCSWEGPKSVSDYIYWTEPTLEQICTFFKRNTVCQATFEL